MAFDPKNITHRKQLYPVLKALTDQDPHKGPLDVLDDAMEQPLSRGTDYLSNVRKGQYAASIATRLYGWLDQNHFHLAHEISPDVFTQTVEQRWRSLLDERASTGRFRLALVPLSMGIVERASTVRPVDATIRLGERFCFEFDSETKGYATAFQGVRDEWHNIPLGPNGETSAPIQSGQNRLPKRSDGQVDPLTENHDEGMHEFVMITAPTDDIPTNIQSLNTWIADTAQHCWINAF